MVGSRVAVVVLGLLAGCSLTTDLSGLAVVTLDGGASSGSSTGGPGVVDGGPPPVFSFDAGVDAAKAEPLPTGGVVVAADVTAYAAGAAQQHHVHFARNLGAWVVFYMPAAQRSVIATRLTPDFVSFVDGPTLALPKPHDGDGRNFDVAYADVGGADIFHVAYSTKEGKSRFSYRARGRGAGGTLAFGAATELGSSNVDYNTLDPDGPAVVLLTTGHVMISSGFNSFGGQGHVGNFCAFQSKQPDTGAVAWDESFAPGVEIRASDTSVNARAIAVAPNGALGLWEAADSDPRPKRLDFATFDGTSWSGADNADFPSTAFDVADWGMARANDGRIHAVRYAGGAYLHRYYTTTGMAGFAIPAATHSEGDGVVVIGGDDTNVLALDASAKAIRRTRLTGAGTTWSAWEEVAGGDATRRHLSGNAGVVMWERKGAGTDLVALKLR